MKFNRSGAVLSLLVAGALVLSGCGSTTHASSSGSSPAPAPVQCGGKKKLKASGATAQENAMEQFVYAYVHACPGYTLDYNANGSGAGVTDFLSNVDRSGRFRRPVEPIEGSARPRGAAVRFAGLGPAGGVRTDRGHLQHQRGELAETGRAHAREDFQRRHHQVERPGDQGAQPRHQPASRRPFTSSSAATNPPTHPTSSNTSMPHPTVPGAKAPARRSTGVSVTAPAATTARRRRCRAPTGRSPTTSGRSRWANS